MTAPTAGPRASNCVEHLHMHVGICQRAGYANGLKDAAALATATPARLSDEEIRALITAMDEEFDPDCGPRDDWGQAIPKMRRALNAAAILAARAVRPTPPVQAEALDPEVERGVRCFHGTPRACESYRCGSNCSQRFDRMHPCPACLIAQIHDLRAAVRTLGGDPYNLAALPVQAAAVAAVERVRALLRADRIYIRSDGIRAALAPTPDGGTDG